MSYHSDLLEQARHLLELDTTRPRQANLRRAVSTAYYALFHLLINEAARGLASDDLLRARISRAFTHTEMKDACKSFKGTKLPEHVLEACPQGVATIVPDPLKSIAETFIDLQAEREEADYGINYRLTRSEARQLIERVGQAFSLWESVRSQPISKVFLASLLLWKKWGRGTEK